MRVATQLAQSPLLLAALAAAVPALAAWGVVLLRAPRPGENRLGLDALAAEDAKRPSVVTRLLDDFGRRLTPMAMQVLGERLVTKTRWQLEAAGRPGGYTLETFIGRRAVFALFGLFVGLLQTVQGNPLFGLCALVGGAMLMDVWLSRTLRQRQAAIEKALPDFLDILAVTIIAGLSFRQALGRLAEALTGPLAEEIGTTLRQMEIGVSRRQALENLRDRNESPTLSSFVTALLQGEELGAPLSSTLTELAADHRRTWAQEARRRAARAEPKVSLVLSTLIAPASILLFAAGMLLDLFGGANGFGNLLGT